MSLIVDFCGHAAAKHAVMRWHYSKTMPIGKLVKLGVWEDDQFIGVVAFARGASPNYGIKFGVNVNEVCELVRVALTDHRTPVTQIVAIALKRLKETSPGIRVVVSYADTGQGHLGTIYQAGNWTYLGTAGLQIEYFYRGKWVHNRTLRGPVYKTSDLPEIRGGMTYPELQHSLPQRPSPLKHKYAYPLDRQMRRRIVKMALPYPTRDDLAAQVSEARHRASGPEGQVQSLGAA